MKVSSITSNINNSDWTNKNSTNKQEEKNPEFGLMLEKSENDLISSENSITDDKISENSVLGISVFVKVYPWNDCLIILEPEPARSGVPIYCLPILKFELFFVYEI